MKTRKISIAAQLFLFILGASIVFCLRKRPIVE